LIVQAPVDRQLKAMPHVVTHSPLTEKQQRSDVQLSKRLASLGMMGVPETPLVITAISYLGGFPLIMSRVASLSDSLCKIFQSGFLSLFCKANQSLNYLTIFFYFELFKDFFFILNYLFCKVENFFFVKNRNSPGK